MFFLIGLLDMAVHWSSITPNSMLSGFPKKPQTKFDPKKTMPLPEFLKSSAN